MTSTNRDFKSFFPSFSPEPLKTVVSRASALKPPSFTSASSKTQAAAIQRLVGTACRLHAFTKGSTVSLVDGDLVGRKLFAVSIYPDQSIELGSPPNRQDIFVFVLLNLHLLVKPAHAFGSWFDPVRNVHVLDVVICVSTLHAAIELGLLFGQTSIYDLAAQAVIKIETVASGRLRNQETKATVR